MLFGKLFKRKGLKVKVKRLQSASTLPTRGSDYSAGYDLYAGGVNTIVIPPGKTMKIGTGLAFELPRGYFAAIFARSGLATKHGLRPANCVGVCDEDYRGEYIVPLHNDSDEDQYILAGDRVAQMILMKYEDVTFDEVSELSDTGRGAGGFGHTGA